MLEVDQGKEESGAKSVDVALRPAFEEVERTVD